MINTRHMRQLHASYNGGNKPDAGAISTMCNSEFDRDPLISLHGKIVERAIKNKLQGHIGGNIDLCLESTALNDITLRQISDEIWRQG